MREPSHPETAAIELTRVLYALSDPVRLDVVRQLDREGEASCTALDRGRPKYSMSHHFRVLRDAGVVRTRCEGPADRKSGVEGKRGTGRVDDGWRRSHKINRG